MWNWINKENKDIKQELQTIMNIYKSEKIKEKKIFQKLWTVSKVNQLRKKDNSRNY